LGILALVAVGCRDERSSVAAARADSSAAGYEVGTTTERPAAAPAPAQLPNVSPTVTTGATTQVASGATTPVSRSDSGATRGSMPDRNSRAGTEAARPDSARRAQATRDRTLPNGVKVAARPDSIRVTPPPAGPVRVNEFLTYDARTRTVSLQLIAGYNGLNGSLNYNGATHGSHGISIPLGWRIHVAVANHDSDLQHSAIVVRELLPPPIEPADPAFAGAALPNLEEGLQENETGTLDFAADRVGHYMIACGVPGHAQAGMWLQLVIASDVLAPAYR
jgi:hypothetical protein